MFVGRGPGAPNSVHRDDVDAVLEVAAFVRGAHARVHVADPFDSTAAVPAQVEFCVSGIDANERTAAHLRRYLPGVAIPPLASRSTPEASGDICVDGAIYSRIVGKEDYVLLARVVRPGKPHVFLVVGQTAISNLAAMRFMSANLHRLWGRFRGGRTFCLIIRVVEPSVFGAHEADEIADVTGAAQRRIDQGVPTG